VTTSDSQVIQEERNRELVREVYKTAFVGDMTVFNGAVSEDFEAHVAPALPWGGVHRGPEAFLTELLPALAAAVDGASFRVTSISADGDDVVALVSAQSVGGDDLWIAEHWTFHDGKIARLRVFYFDARPVQSVPAAGAS
jgi:ketosteroid isomerase-like protein